MRLLLLLLVLPLAGCVEREAEPPSCVAIELTDGDAYERVAAAPPEPDMERWERRVEAVPGLAPEGHERFEVVSVEWRTGESWWRLKASPEPEVTWSGGNLTSEELRAEFDAFLDGAGWSRDPSREAGFAELERRRHRLPAGDIATASLANPASAGPLRFPPLTVTVHRDEGLASRAEPDRRTVANATWTAELAAPVLGFAGGDHRVSYRGRAGSDGRVEVHVGRTLAFVGDAWDPAVRWALEREGLLAPGAAAPPIGEPYRCGMAGNPVIP